MVLLEKKECQIHAKVIDLDLLYTAGMGFIYTDQQDFANFSKLRS